MDSKGLVVETSVGVLSGVMQVIIAVSAATLLFPLDLSRYFLTGVTISVIAVITTNFIAGLRNRVPFATYGLDLTPIFLFSLVSAQLFSQLPSGKFEPAIITFIMLASIITGGTFYLVGRFKLSNLARFVPFPVVAGFMGGIALLIVQQSLGSLAGVGLTLANAGQFFAPAAMLHWLPGVLFALVILMGSQYASTKWLPGNVFRDIIIFASIAIFLAVLTLNHTSIHQAFDQGWSARPVDGRLPFQLFIANAWDPPTLFALIPHVNILLIVVGISLI